MTKLKEKKRFSLQSDHFFVPLQPILEINALITG